MPGLIGVGIDDFAVQHDRYVGSHSTLVGYTVGEKDRMLAQKLRADERANHICIQCGDLYSVPVKPTGQVTLIEGTCSMICTQAMRDGVPRSVMA